MITRCEHYMNGRREPCPPMCPAQTEPRYMWRRNWRGRWVLRREFRNA